MFCHILEKTCSQSKTVITLYTRESLSIFLKAKNTQSDESFSRKPSLMTLILHRTFTGTTLSALDDKNLPAATIGTSAGEICDYSFRIRNLILETRAEKRITLCFCVVCSFVSAVLTPTIPRSHPLHTRCHPVYSPPASSPELLFPSPSL